MAMQENLKTEVETVGNISSGAGVWESQNKTYQDKTVVGGRDDSRNLNLKTEEQSLETMRNISSGAGVRGNQNKTENRPR